MILLRLGETLRSESDTVIIFGDGIQGAAIRDLVRWGLSLRGRTRFIALGDYANSRGAADMGVLPATLPGYSTIGDEAARAAFRIGLESTFGRETRTGHAPDDRRNGIRRHQGPLGVRIKSREDFRDTPRRS